MQFLGIGFIILGFCAIIFKKYPGKNIILDRLRDKYVNVNEKILAYLNGISNIISGLLILIFYINNLLKYREGYLLMIAIFIILSIAYYPIRKKCLNLK